LIVRGGGAADGYARRLSQIGKFRTCHAPRAMVVAPSPG
jgi:hypothetical protein